MVQYAALAAYQMWSAYQQAEIIEGQAELTKNVSDMNARYAEIDAWEAEKHGYSESARYQSVIDQTIGEQRAAYAAANVDVSYGTAAEVQQESKVTGFLNQLDMQRQARAKSLGLKFEASNYRLTGAMQSLQGEAQAGATRAAGIANGLGTAISGYTKYLSDQKDAAREAKADAEKAAKAAPATDPTDDPFKLENPFKQNNSLEPVYRLGKWRYNRG